MRTEREIRAQADKLDPEATAGGPSRWPGMTYEQGVDDALRWAVGDSDDAPGEDE